MSKAIAFEKMSGAGNDFVMVDNRERVLSEEELVPFTQFVCPRGTAVGAVRRLAQVSGSFSG